MTVRLDEGVELLEDSVLHIGQATFDTKKKHRAIKSACLRFMRMVNCDVQTKSVTLGSGESTLDMNAEVDGWNDTQFIRAHIDNTPVRKSDDASVRRLWEDGVTPTAAQPTLVTCVSPTDWLFDAPTDAEYTLKVVYRSTLTAFTPGANTDPILNIPDEWIYDVIWWGARAFLLHGSPKHVDAQPAFARFNEIIVQGAKAFGGTASGVDDIQVAD